MDRYFIILLRAAALAAILVGLFGQFVVIPGMAADEVALVPQYAPFATPYVTVAVLIVACVQVALGAVWALLGILDRDALFTPRAFRWVDVIIGSTVVATLLTAGIAVHLTVADIPAPNGNMDVIGAMGAAMVTTAVGAALAMLLVLMRGLLRKATNLQTEMAEVI
ncbi:DUF2975 domain-containing protein [Nocardiopsis alba]|uniref:DUF2975 domain-containing protein n=2 Tax=Nocardiopsis alba TaxID=53437 RepID=A0ABV5DZZ3_9ACTN|nr:MULTISPECIES: DUF2975 domain-containing protein [Nocardiopsis]AFR08842.1 hypothetical protein B005_2407 [Nocardiopsis alba ATCC BAA-2165]MEC3893671.1 DUF2975 domain-containing protein [Nocardiopsis sp. LDBS1602]